MPEIPYAAIQGLAEELLGEGRPVKLRVSGWSMWPAIPNDTSVQIQPLDPREVNEQVKEGMVVLVSGNKWLVHRVLKITGDKQIITRGDFLFKPDKPAPLSAVKGIVTHSYARKLPEPLALRKGPFFTMYRLCLIMAGMVYNARSFLLNK